MRSFDSTALENLLDVPLKSLCAIQSADDGRARNHSTFIQQQFTGEESTNIYSTQKETSLKKSIYCNYRPLQINKQLLSSNKEPRRMPISQQSAKQLAPHPLNATVKPMQFASHPYLHPHKAQNHSKPKINKAIEKNKETHTSTTGLNKSLKTNYQISVKIQPTYTP
jgi:hypothetical protein